MTSKRLAKDLDPNLISRRTVDGRWEIFDGQRVIGVSYDPSNAWNSAYQKLKCPLRHGNIVRAIGKEVLYELQDHGTYFKGVAENGELVMIEPASHSLYEVVV